MTSSGRKPRRRRWRWLLAALLPLVLLGVAGQVQLGRVEREALVLAETGQAAIQLLSAYAAALRSGATEEAAALYVDDYLGPVLGEWGEDPEPERDGIRTWKWRSESEPAPEGGVASRLSAFTSRLGTLEFAKLKLARVEAIQGPDRATVRSVLWLQGSHGEPARRWEMQGTLRLELVQSRGAWRIANQRLLSGRTVVGDGRGFEEVAEAAGIDFVARRNPNFDTPEWAPERFGIVKYGSAGVSAVDYDGDGWDDIFLADGAAARLFRNQGDGTFEETTETAGLPTPLVGVNIGLFADFDNDGDRDLFLGIFTSGNRMFRNEGDGTFREVTEGAGLGGIMVTTASASDYDGDGQLDLYVGRYLDPRTELPDTLFYTRNGEGNSLLRNLGGLKFEDVTEAAGVREGGLALGVAWADYDDDGDDDLYVANDFGRNALLRNEADGTFSDVSAEAGALDFGFGMSSTWGDVDNDGDFDVYVSNVHSGQRWYGQAATLRQYLTTSLRQGTIREDFPLYREIFGYAGADWRDYGDGMVKGNSLLLNEGGAFTDVAEVAGANPFGWYWGSVMFDFDNDSRLDLYGANGWITGKSHDDL